MSLNNIPFYITWNTYINFVSTNFNNLNLSNDSLFIGYILIQALYLYLIIQVVKFTYTFCIFLKNLFSR